MCAKIVYGPDRPRVSHELCEKHNVSDAALVNDAADLAGALRR